MAPIGAHICDLVEFGCYYCGPAEGLFEKGRLLRRGVVGTLAGSWLEDLRFAAVGEGVPSFLRFLDSWFEQFGGTTGGYARQEERTVLIADNSRYKIAPAICYESIYGEFMAKFVKNGANIICVITNDGWWGETPGYNQHKSYARLRAIETRCWVVRSANTGTSCFIDPIGNTYQELPWNVASAIKQSVPPNLLPATFYVKNGDLISKGAIGLAIVFIIWNIFMMVKSGRHAKRTEVSK